MGADHRRAPASAASEKELIHLEKWSPIADTEIKPPQSGDALTALPRYEIKDDDDEPEGNVRQGGFADYWVRSICLARARMQQY